ncbi:hypothetical protein TI39_contig4202g00018 [Zymoseptoria brevis]|uniref:Uncharacterized protein n=1 Tax=Zymoseptoria brevis TaxID=1047168 RepID=A0A0F4GAE8_9PEZI|nr:hypothetical protein TI39_contig4202g00018 [Zymoseptoria brevis]
MSRLKEHKALRLRLIALPTEILIQIAGDLLPPFTSVQTIDPARQTTEDLESFIDDETVKGYRDMNALKQTCKRLRPVVYEASRERLQGRHAPLKVSFIHPRSSFPTNTAFRQISDRHRYLAAFDCVEVVVALPFCRRFKETLFEGRTIGHDMAVKKLTIKIGRTVPARGWRPEYVCLETLRAQRYFDSSILELAAIEDAVIDAICQRLGAALMSLYKKPLLQGYQMLCNLITDMMEDCKQYGIGPGPREKWWMLNQSALTFKDNPAADEPELYIYPWPTSKLGWQGKRHSSK